MDWGLIGASTIASEHVIGAIRAQGGTIASVLSSDAGRGAEYAARHRIPASTTDLGALLSVPGLDTVGQERRPVIAILRRIWDFIPYIGDIWVPFVFHFDFTDKATGAVVLVSERQKAIRDRYTVTVPDPRIDFRVAASMAVALDALQSR